MTPGMSTPNVKALRPEGIASSTSWSITFWTLGFCTSTSGASPVTVIVSSSAATRRSALIVAVKNPVSSIPSRLIVLKPGSVNVTLYVAGPQFHDPVLPSVVGHHRPHLLNEGRTGRLYGHTRQDGA